MGSFFAKHIEHTIKIEFGRENNLHRPSNHVSTTKYSLVTFIPKALLLQFTRAANFVYLISAILQSITIISSLSPITAIGPLIFVLSVSLVRQGFQDYKRHKTDIAINERVSLRLVNGVFNEIKWQDIQAGDIIKVKNHEMIPCDMVILYTSQQNSICYVQTSNLDGETNLKSKFAFVEEIFLYPDQFDLLEGFLEVEKPSSQLYEFNGHIKLLNHQQKPLAFENLLLRQTHLKNTSEIVGIAVYCGKESKIMMNKGHIEHKVTKVQRRVNIIQIWLFIVLLCLCIVCSVGFYLKLNSIGRKNFFYLKDIGLSLPVQALLIFFTCFLLLNFLIPISLNVLIEFTKAFLTLFLGFDRKFRDQNCPDGIHVSNMSIMEQLGIIDYLLTDKTGTLTANEMIFRSCCIQDKVFETQTLQSKMQNLPQNSAFHNFWIAVIICHEVVKDETSQMYQGSSPDEVCFINYAKKIGYQFIKRTKNYIELNIRGQKIVYQLLHILPFTQRKRMSVIVKSLTENNEILLFTKGADSAIFQKSIPYRYQQSFEYHIDEYAKLGLRTLVFSYRKMKTEEIQWILNKQKDIKFYKFSKTKTIEQIIELEQQIFETIQCNLGLLGATAIEDRLQDQVPQTIARLQAAGITVMMITGDKLETAQNVGYLANLIRKEFKIIKIRANDQNVYQKIKQILNELESSAEAKIGVLIQGTSIRKVVEQSDLQILKVYAKFMKKCTSVIFCRSSPKQKALIVKFVKLQLQGVVLAIGDGGNDTGMIEAANIGVGILGREGNSAAAVSDFYFGQFRHLDRLLLHHGRWFYIRLSYFFVYYGWKNLIITVLMFIYITRSAYSGYPAFSELYITMYNLLIGMFIIGYYGVWSQDINDDLHPDVWERLPLLYRNAKMTDLFSYKRYIIWTIMGILIAVFLDYYVELTLGDTDVTIDSNGNTIDYDGLYFTKSVAIIIITIVVVIMDLRSFTCYTLTVALGAFTFGFIVLVYALENSKYFGRGYKSLIIYDQTKVYLVILGVLGVTVGIKMIINMVQIEFYPTQVDKILVEKHNNGQLSIDNISPILNPKQLLFKIHDKVANKNQSKQTTLEQKRSSSKDKKLEKTSKNTRNSRNQKLESSQQKGIIQSDCQLHQRSRQVESIDTKKNFLKQSQMKNVFYE